MGWSAGSSLGTNIQLVLYKNGSHFITLSRTYTTQSSNDVNSGATLVNLNAGDYIEVWANVSRTRTVRGDAKESYFIIIKVA